MIRSDRFHRVREFVLGCSADELRGVIAMANHCLPDSDPKKITRAFVEDERAAYRAAVLCARAYQDQGMEEERMESSARAGRHLDRARALKAYLPPDDQ
jgi:hypothetical protein